MLRWTDLLKASSVGISLMPQPQRLAPCLFCSIIIQEQVADGSFITRRVEEVPVRFGKGRLMTMCKVRNATEAAIVQLEKPISLHPNNVSQGCDDRDDGHAEPKEDLQDKSHQSAGGLSALRQIQSLCEKTGSDIPAAVLKAYKLKAQERVAIPDNSVLSAASTAVSDAFKLEKNRCKKINELKTELSFQHGSESSAKLEEFCQAYGADILALQKKLRDRDSSIEFVWLQLDARVDTTSSPHVECHKSNVSLYRETPAVANIYFILLGYLK